MRRQHGVIARGQLRELGLDDDRIDERVRKGALIRVERGVYAVGHDGLTDRGRWMAGVLACGAGAVLSHRSAASLWSLRRPGLPLIDVSVPRHTSRKSRGHLRVHRSRCLPYSDVTRKHAIPVTKPARTLLDLAEVVGRRELERALDEATLLRVCTIVQLRAAVKSHPGRVGGARLQAVLDYHDLGSTATANDFEELLFALCEAHHLPRPEVNVELGPYKPDFLWRVQRLVVETDGYDTHSRRRVFESDHARDTELMNAGWKVRRFTWRQLTEQPDWVAAKLREALAQRAELVMVRTQ